MSLPADTIPADEPDTPSTTNVADRLSQQFWQLMPVPDLETALHHIVELWWSETTAESVLLITPSPDERSLWFHLYDQTRSLVETGHRFPCSADWAENILALLEDQWRSLFPTSHMHELRFLPLHTTGPVRGMLVCSFLHSSDEAELDQAAEITSRFLEQVRAGASPASHTRLRELKLQALAEFAAGAGHEINNPLATISGRAQLLLKDETDPERREMLANIGAQALRIRDMIGDLMLYARPPAPELEPIPFLETVREVIDQLKARYSEDVVIDFDPQVRPDLLADRAQLEISLYNLIENGLLHTPDDRDRVVRISCRSGFQDQLQIDIHSPNSNLSDLDERHLFDPFYSGRQAGRGLGFGLSKVWQIVKQHDATISIQSDEATGTRITLHWPIAVTV